ncbi:MAG: hypothetical protein ACM3ON_12995 [Chloroflexota bacterium]
MSDVREGEGLQPLEYINDFLFFAVKPDEAPEAGRFVFCSGVSLSRFLPLTKGRHGLASNPALRGLQLVNLDVRALALSRGAVPKSVRENVCSGMAPPEEDWYVESLLIEGAPGSFREELTRFAVIGLLKKITGACMLPDINIPEPFPEPAELQVLIEDLCTAHGR